MYADDTVLYANMRTNQEETSMEDLKWKVRKVFEACTALKLKLNPDKTEVLLLSTKKKRPNIGSFELNDSEVKLNKSLITLGVTVDECLNFEMQINRVTSSCYNELRKLQRVKHYLSFESRKIAVQNLILSRLDYCNSLLGGTNKSSRKKLQRVQNAAFRFIFNLRKQELCKKYRYILHWLPIAQRIDFKILTFVHKIVFDLDIPNYLKDLIFVQEKNNAKRSENQWKLKFQSFRNSYGKSLFSLRSTKMECNAVLPTQNIRSQTLSQGAFFFPVITETTFQKENG